MEPTGEAGNVTQPAAKPAGSTKLPIGVHILCGWPLILVAFGGAIGGALGGVAWGINVALYKSKLPTPAKIVLNLLVGLAAVGTWLAIGTALART